MRIYLDDFETSLCATDIAGALRAAAELVEQSGRMIVEVSVDGVAWGEEDLASPDFTARALNSRASMEADLSIVSTSLSMLLRSFSTMGSSEVP